MNIRPTLLALALALGFLVAPPATAGGGSGSSYPGLEVELDRAWRVSRGAAVELAYTVQCPEASEGGQLHSIDVRTADGPDDVIEFWCYPDGPQRVVILLPGWSPPRGTEITVDSSTTNLLFAPWDPDIPGALKVDRTDTTTIRRGAFEPESLAELRADLRLVRTRLTPSGDVRVVHRLRCDEPSLGRLVIDVLQRRGDRIIGARGGSGDTYLECEPGQVQTLKYVVRPDPGAFAPGKAIVDAVWTQCDENCPRGVTSAEVILQRD